MAVLTMAGKPIDWRKPPKPTTKAMWSQRTTGGALVVGSFRSICHLDHLNTLALKKFGVGIIVFQSAYHTGYKPSAGTHDGDAVYDVWIPGVPGDVQERFFRANGAGGFHRTNAQGFTTIHIHYLCLPPWTPDVSKGYSRLGVKVGYLVDGGWSQYGRVVASSQIGDYYSHRDATSSHAPDDGWFPADIRKTIFDLDAYVKRQVALLPPLYGTLEVLTANIASKAKVPELASTIKEFTPAVVVVSEAYFAREFLAGIEGYRNYQYTRKKYGSEGPDISVLVRKGVKVSRRRPLRMVMEWVGPKGGEHDGRVYPSLNVRVGKHWWRLLGIHFPTRNNSGAQRESERAVNKWFKADERRSVAPGDFNQEPKGIEAWTVAEVAAGTKVDHALYARCAHRKTQRLRPLQPEGMHGWVLYTFTTEKKD